jgi:outer membrane protein insertion porin family
MTDLRRIGCGVGACVLQRLHAVFLFLAIAMACAALPGAAQAQSYVFNRIQVDGLERIETATVISLAGIGRGATVTAGELNDVYQRVQGSGLFETVEVVPQGATLLIRVREYPTINLVNFEGNRRLKDEDLAALIVSKSRHVYSPATVEADANLIVEAYAQSGRMAARVNPKVIRRDGNRVDLAFEIAEGAVTEVERISFAGNRNFSDRRLRQVLETKQAGIFRTLVQRDTFVSERVEFDKQLLTDFYRSRGYIDFQVLSANSEFSRERNGFFMTFNVHEGQVYTFATITTISEIDGADADEFQREVKIRSGSTYSPSVIDATISRMEALALNKGLNFVRIEPRISRNDANLTLDLTFALTRGPRVFVERIDIEGNTTTLDQVVRRQFRTVEGDPFNPREIRNAAERIRALGFFSTTDVNTRPGSDIDQVVVDVNVEEQPTGSLNFGATYALSSGLGGTIQLQESNFLGRGQYLAVDFSTATANSNSQLTFIEPQFLGRDLKLKFNAYYNTADNNFANFKTRFMGVSPAIDFPISTNGRLELRYTVKNEELYDIAAGSSPILAGDVAALTSSVIGYTYTHDTRLSGLSQNASAKLRFSQDYSGLGGDVNSVRTTALLSAQTRVLHEEVILRAELEGGAVNMLSGNSRIVDRFSGTNVVRGFEPSGFGPRDTGAVNNDALGGNYYAALRLEAEFPLGFPEEYGLTGGVFADIGSVWGLQDTAGATGTVDDSMHLRSSIGVSLFWNTVIGPLRFNFAKPISKQSYDIEQAFDLTISTRF